MNTEVPPENIGTKSPLALIAGPTASGKTDCAINLALALQKRGKTARIINADSAQVYADLRILSARPSAEEMQDVPHMLFGTWDGAEPCSAADWAQAAKQEIARCHVDGAVPILVGGTGMYIRSLLDGIAPVPDIPHHIRDEVRAMSQTAAREALQHEDPEAASKLAEADKARTTRALEVIRATGKPISYWHALTQGGIGACVDLHPLVILPERAWLFDRCDRRFEIMMESGAIGEVASLMARELDPSLPVMRAIGVREIAKLITGEISTQDAARAGQLATRQYAKRQYTWFRGQSPRHWPQIESRNITIDGVFESLLQF